MKTIKNTYLNPLELVESVKYAFSYARDVGPIFMLTKCFRWTEHVGVGFDWHLKYRNKSDLDKWQLADLESNPEGLNLSKKDLDKVNNEISIIVDRLFINAENEIDSNSQRFNEGYLLMEKTLSYADACSNATKDINAKR